MTGGYCSLQLHQFTFNMHVWCLVVLIKEKKAIDFHNNIGIHKFTESAYAFPEGISKNIGPVRFAEKPG